jgi:hypothetical protein
MTQTHRPPVPDTCRTGGFLRNWGNYEDLQFLPGMGNLTHFRL